MHQGTTARREGNDTGVSIAAPTTTADESGVRDGEGGEATQEGEARGRCIQTTVHGGEGEVELPTGHFP